ncbi:MAG TPA: histidine kinase dimerization/phospho-acceptor domain-containing protein, partial [bacterium]|nr:histidine kinase dimerization/phospho-acceptor domain-containing protein [bacterium]
MASLETTHQVFQSLIRTRTVCIILLGLLLFTVEGGLQAEAGCVILMVAAVFSLLFALLGRSKHLAAALLPFVFPLDSLFLSAWVGISGGATSYYLPLFMLILASAVLVLPPRLALVVLPVCGAIFLGSFYLDYAGEVPAFFDASQVNRFAAQLASAPPGERAAFYWEQGLRWFFYSALMVTVCVLLMRQVWSREEKIHARERHLEQKRRLIQLGELTGRIAHGVNTPLGLISGNLELLMARTRKGSPAHRSLSQIRQYVDRAVKTVRGILDYSRLSLSEVRPVDLAEVARTVAEAVDPKLKKTGGKLILDLQPGLPPLLAYPEGLFQVLLNLVENAVDSVPPGRGVVTVAARFQPHPVRLSVQDDRGSLQVTV